MVFGFWNIFRISLIFSKFCKLFCSLIICLICVNGFSFAYQQEGFSKYQESENGVFFECEKVCFIVLGERGKADVLYVDGAVTGSGTFMIFSTNGNKNSLIYGDKLSYNLNSYLVLPNYKKTLYSVPKDAKLLIQVNGNMKGNLKIDKISYSFSQNVSSIRKDFWTMEPFYQYGTNMKYGVSIRGNVITKYGYVIFALSLLLILIFVRGKMTKKFRIIFYVGIGLVLLIGIRNAVTYTYNLNQGLSGFKDNKEFFDMGDFIPFIEQVRDEINLSFEEGRTKDCKIFIQSNGNRNINDHGRFYLKPCKQVITGDLADYKLYYKVNIPREDSSKKILVDFNGSYLLDNKSR